MKQVLKANKSMAMVFRKSGERIDLQCQFTFEGKTLDRLDEF